MTPLTRIFAAMSVIALINGFSQAFAQTGVNFAVSGSFQNPVAESSNSILITDNDLTNGYKSGSDLYQAPSGLGSSGPSGSAFFQWGTPSGSSDHSSALWFKPYSVSNVVADQKFDIGSIYYRNGTIQSGTGANAVDLSLTFRFSSSSSMTTVFTGSLINTPNTGTADQQADYVLFEAPFVPTTYKDSHGNTYYLELSFREEGTSTNSASFHVYEGATEQATLVGRFTTTPGTYAIPEPSALLLGAFGSLLALRRQRRA